MRDGDVVLRSADDALDFVETLLERNGLPSRDVRSKSDRFYVAYADGDPVGVGGVEPHGSDGLLRSLVVERSARGNGFGAAICERLEAKARANGVATLYLLTTTAPDFFATRGYAAIDRSDAPASIRQTREFNDLCPTTAVCMRKSL